MSYVQFFFLRVMHDNFIIHSYPTLQIKVHLLTADNALNDWGNNNSFKR